MHTINPGFVETPGFPQKDRFPFPLDRLLVVRLPLVVERTLRAIELRPARDRRAALVPRLRRGLQALVPGIVARVLGRLPHF